MSEDESVLRTEAGEAFIGDSADESGSLQERLTAAQALAEENYNKFLLATADFENYKKRVARDREAILTSHRGAILERFLPVLDNLERALKYEAGGEGLRGGIEQTLRGFEAVLAGQGVKEIAVKDKAFDPRVAEAIGTTLGDGVADDTVVEVVEKGYSIGDELLRPAKVIVAKSAG
ncbi:MAG TPA: nucleotide exchange factor GrpE [Candidatus Tumulicola sp.]|jgi:molecular chaperone GrpE